MSGDNTDPPDCDPARCAAQASLDVRKSIESGQEEAAAAHALRFWLYDQLARADNPAEGERRMLETMLRFRAARNWNPARPRPALHMVINNTI